MQFTPKVFVNIPMTWFWFFNYCNCKVVLGYQFGFFLNGHYLHQGFELIWIPSRSRISQSCCFCIRKLSKWVKWSYMKDKVAFAQLGRQFSVMMDKLDLVILEVPVTKFLKKGIYSFPPLLLRFITICKVLLLHILPYSKTGLFSFLIINWHHQRYWNCI